MELRALAPAVCLALRQSMSGLLRCGPIFQAASRPSIDSRTKSLTLAGPVRRLQPVSVQRTLVLRHTPTNAQATRLAAGARIGQATMKCPLQQRLEMPALPL